MNPGGGPRALMAYRSAYMRFVATNDVDISREWMRGSRRDDAALYTAFTLTVTASYRTGASLHTLTLTFNHRR